jgi:hypothetical protein
MAPEHADQIAARYLKEQADIIKKYGDAPQLSGERYDHAVSATRKTFEAISRAKDETP